MTTSVIPNIDPTVKHVGVSKLRDLNASKLKKQKDETFVIQENDTPLAVLLAYRKFLAIQEQYRAAINELEHLSDGKEHRAVLAAYEELAKGFVRPLSDIEADLENL